MARTTFDRERLVQAFGHLGRDLASRGVFLELAVYGGSAIMLHYAWRKGTEDVDTDALQSLYASIHGERPPAELLTSFASVLA